MGARRDHTATIGSDTWESSVPVICSAESIVCRPWVNLGPFGRNVARTSEAPGPALAGDRRVTGEDLWTRLERMTGIEPA